MPSAWHAQDSSIAACVLDSAFKAKLLDQLLTCRFGVSGLIPAMWVWRKIKLEGLRRFWSMFPLARVPVWYRCFLSHSHVFDGPAVVWFSAAHPVVHAHFVIATRVACCERT